MTICPGKRGESYYGARWERSLELDLQSIEDFGATCLVTLMRSSELERLKVPVQKLAGNFQHYLVPVHDEKGPDFDPYNEGILERWQNTIHQCIDRLSNREK